MGETTMRDGRCLCGAVRYRVTGEPIWTAHCHCQSCRRATSAAFATYAGYLRDRFEFSPARPPSIAHPRCRAPLLPRLWIAADL